MVCYVCNKCDKNFTESDYYKSEKCPLCHSYLKVKTIVEKGCDMNKCETNEKKVPSSYGEQEANRKSLVKRKKEPSKNVEPQTTCDTNPSNEKTKTQEKVLEGKIVSAVSDANYNRYFWTKLSDKYFYGQRVNNMLNTVIVRCKDTTGVEQDERIMWYGIIKGGIGELRTGMDIRAEGKFNQNNEFIATNIVTDTKAKVCMKYEIGDVIAVLFPLILALAFWSGKEMYGLVQTFNLCHVVYGLVLPISIGFSGTFLLMKNSRKSFWKKCKWGLLAGVMLRIILWIV